MIPMGQKGQKGQNRTGPEQQNLFLPSRACFYYSHSFVVISFPSLNRNTTRSSAWTVTWSTVPFQSFSSKVSGRAVSSPKEAESKNEDDDSDNHPGAGGNSGTMIVDATCAPSNIRYPQDVSLLNEARESAEKLLDVLHDPADGKKPRTYRQRARKDYLKYVRCRKHTAKMTRKAIGKQLTYLWRALNAVDGKLSLGKSLTTRQMKQISNIPFAAVHNERFLIRRYQASLPRGFYFPNSSAACFIRCMMGTLKGYCVSQRPQPIHSPA